MGSWKSFALGMVVGFALLHTMMSYHVVLTERGTHLIPKHSASLSGTFADVRGYSIAEWRHRPDLAKAMIRASRRGAENEPAWGLDRIQGFLAALTQR